jgi:tRNA-modifying protein YgfZ
MIPQTHRRKEMAETTPWQALRESAVLVDGAGHDVLGATGEDRVGFLHRITSGRVAGIEPGQGGRTLLLDMRGHVLASLLVFVRAGSVRLIVPAGQGGDVVAGLARFAIMDDFHIAAETELTSLAVLGPAAALVLRAAGVVVPAALAEAPLNTHLEVSSDAWGPLWLVRGRRCGADGLCVVAARAAREELVQALLARETMRLPPDIDEALRISAMEPRPGSEITPDRFPSEIGLGAAIDHGKGCYVGQETIVRMRDRGSIRKRLVLLRLSSAEPPEAGDKIAAASQSAAGQVTSAGRVPGEQPVALAILATAVSVGATVQIERQDARLEAVVAAESPPWG